MLMNDTKKSHPPLLYNVMLELVIRLVVHACLYSLQTNCKVFKLICIKGWFVLDHMNTMLVKYYQ